MPRKEAVIVNHEKKEIKIVMDIEMSKKDLVKVKNCEALGYTVISTDSKTVYTSKEKIFTEENIKAFLKTKGKEAEKMFDEEKARIAIDKKTDTPKLNKKGEPKTRGFVGALKWFRAKYEDEFREFIKEKK